VAFNSITARLRLRDRARFRRDAENTADDIRKIGRAAEWANAKASSLGGGLGELTKEGAQFGSRARIFGFAVGTVITAFIALIPLVVGLGGALVALTGSLAAATIGAGLLAGALGGVLLLGMGAVGLVIADVASNFTAVNERYQTWRNAVKSFGPDSKQAINAFARLNGVVANNGGPAILSAVQAWTELRSEFEKQMAPVLAKLAGAMFFVFGAVKKLLPTIANFTDIIVTSLGPVLRLWIGALTSSSFKTALMIIAAMFARIAGPIGLGILKIFQGMLTLVVRVSPYLGGIADGFASIATKFAAWTSTVNLEPFIAQFRSWWGLLKAVGGLLVTILSGGASQGQGLVDALTGVINGWNNFLKGTKGQSDMASFFKDSIDMTKAFAGFIATLVSLLFRFGRWALPAYRKFFAGATKLWNEFMAAIAPAKPFFDNILWPLIKGIALGIGASLVGAFKVGMFALKIFARALGWLGTTFAFVKGPIEFLGKLIGFFLGPWILKLLSYVGRISVVLRPLGFLFSQLGRPIDGVGKAIGWVFGWVGKLIGIFAKLAGRYIPWVASAYGKILGFLIGLGPKFFNAGVKLFTKVKDGMFRVIGTGLGFAGDMAKAVANAVIKLLNSAIPNKLPIPGPDIDLPNNPIPMLARGGVVSGAGSWITGESGPELNTLRGGRVTVQPLPAVSPITSDATLVPEGGRRTLISKVYLRGKQIAEAVADEADDALAGA
jgi:hypothetical protein